MKSLHSRLDGEKEAVLRVTGDRGRWEAMRHFGLKDYLCFARWLREVTGDENFGLNPRISLQSGQTLGDQLVAAVLRTVAQLQAQNTELRERIEYLERQLDGHKEKEELQALAILEVCQA